LRGKEIERVLRAICRERERESKIDNAVFGSKWQGARAANAVRIPAGIFSLVADSGMVLFVSGASNLIVIDRYYH